MLFPFLQQLVYSSTTHYIEDDIISIFIFCLSEKKKKSMLHLYHQDFHPDFHWIKQSMIPPVVRYTLAGVLGGLYGVAVSWVVNCTLVEISVNTFFAVVRSTYIEYVLIVI